MPTPSLTRRERRAQVTDSVFQALPPREILRGLGETVSRLVPVDAISPSPDQPRHRVDETSEEFHELVASIREQRLLQPVNLWQLDDGEERYRLITGERRWRAYRLLAAEEPVRFGRIPAMVTQLQGDHAEANALLLGLIENIVREDLQPGDRADALRRLRDSTGWTYEEVARRMGMTVNRVMDLASIARHEAVRAAADRGAITQKQAIAIGQGTREPELAAALAGVVGSLDEKATREALRAARGLDADLPAEERARRAVELVQAIAVLAPGRPAAMGPAPIEKTVEISRTVGGGRTRPLSQRYVILGNTALAALRPRVGEMQRERLAEVLQQVCEETNIWPRRPRRK